MRLFRKTRTLILVFLAFAVGLIVGAITSYILTAELIVSNHLYTREADHCINTLRIMRSKKLEEESLAAEDRLQELLWHLKRPLFGMGDDDIEIEKLSKRRIQVFQTAKEYYDQFGWRVAYHDQRFSENLREYIERVPWSQRRQELKEWNAKYKGTIPRLAPNLNPVEWLGETTPLASLRGRVVLLDFWGMRCGPCPVSPRGPAYALGGSTGAATGAGSWTAFSYLRESSILTGMFTKYITTI